MEPTGEGVRVRALTPDDSDWVRQRLTHLWGGTEVARKGELVDAAALPGFVAERDGARVGLLTYAHRGDEVEVVSLHAERPGEGVGRALMDRALARTREVGARRLWLITTNDNVRALRFYQRCGMDLVALHRDGAAASRRVKPTLPVIGADGIPLRHELELEMRLTDDAP